MASLIFPLLVAMLGLSWWMAVFYTPRALSLLLGNNLLYYAGVFLFLLGAFCATYAVYVERDPALFLGTLVQCFVGAWLMLAPTAGQRGDSSDFPFLRNFAAMLGACVGVLAVALYLPQTLAVVVTQLWLVLFGAAVILQPRLRIR